MVHRNLHAGPTDDVADRAAGIAHEQAGDGARRQEAGMGTHAAPDCAGCGWEQHPQALWRTLTEPLAARGERLSRAERRAFATQALARAGLADVDVDRLPGSLSVGQAQRVAIARAIAARPALLVADEPTASLDVAATAAITDLLRAVADDGAALLVVSHDRPRLDSYADRVLTMYAGRLAEGDRCAETG